MAGVYYYHFKIKSKAVVQAMSLNRSYWANIAFINTKYLLTRSWFRRTRWYKCGIFFKNRSVKNQKKVELSVWTRSKSMKRPNARLNMRMSIFDLNKKQVPKSKSPVLISILMLIDFCVWFSDYSLNKEMKYTNLRINEKCLNRY